MLVRGPRAGGWDARGVARATRRVRGCLDSMLEPESAASDEFLILPTTTYELSDDGASLGVSTEAAVVRVADLPLAAAGAEGESRGGGPAADGEEGACLETYGIEFTPWEETLGYRVWMGPEPSRRERFLVLASVIDDMTFFGYDRGRAGRRISEEVEGLRAAAEECERGGCRAYPMEVALARLGMLDAEAVGLQRSTDDLEEEFLRGRRALELELNRRSRLDLRDRAARLGAMLSVGYRVSSGAGETAGGE